MKLAHECEPTNGSERYGMFVIHERHVRALESARIDEVVEDLLRQLRVDPPRQLMSLDVEAQRALVHEGVHEGRAKNFVTRDQLFQYLYITCSSPPSDPRSPLEALLSDTSIDPGSRLAMALTIVDMDGMD